MSLLERNRLNIELCVCAKVKNNYFPIGSTIGLYNLSYLRQFRQTKK